MIYVIIGISAVVLTSLKELLGAKQRGKTMGVFFFLIGISLLLSILMTIDRTPTRPNELVINIIKMLGLGEK